MAVAASLTVCAKRGCPNLTQRGLCRTHRLEQRRASDSRRPNAAQRGYDSKWKRTRARYLRSHPTCESDAGCNAQATEVHHRDGKGPNGPHGHEDWNLLAMCKPHHDQLTAQLQPGGWNA